MNLSPRQNALLHLIAKHRSISAARLCAEITLSRETIRKDLVALADKGLIRRAYGRIEFLDEEAGRLWLQEERKLSAVQRRERIMGILKGHRSVRISALANRLKVSAVTIRADLEQLERDGLVVRRHGSASPLSPAAGHDETLEAERFDPKTGILGEHTLLHISPGDTVYLGAGDIARYVAVHLPRNANISIVTDNLDILALLRKRRYTAPVHMLPGRLLPETGAMLVEHAQSFLSEVRIDKAFLSMSSYADGTYYLETDDAVSNAAVVGAYASKLYLILDSRMLDKRGTRIFPYRDFREKVQEILVDDGVDQATVGSLFPRRDPVVVYGADYSFKLGMRQKYRIGFLVDKDRGYFIQEVYNSLVEAVSAQKNLTLDIRESERGFYSTVKNAETLLNERPDLIVNFTLCAESLSYISGKCRGRGVKLITVDLHDPESVYFGADNAAAGTIAADHAIEHIRAQWRGRLDRIIVFARHAIDPITNLRVMSVVEKIQEEICCSDPDPEIIEWDNPIDMPREALMKLLLGIPRSSTILFITFNLPHILESYELIVRHRDARNTLIVGQNFNEQVQALMREPDSPILGCVHYNPDKYGARILDIALRLLSGEAVESVNYTPHSWISRESVLRGEPAVPDR